MKSSTYAEHEVDKHSQFYRTWVLPKCSENSVDYLQDFGAMDGAYYTACHGLVLLVVTFLNRDKEVLILAWALVPQEDYENWLWFLRKIAPYLTFFYDPDTVIISN